MKIEDFLPINGPKIDEVKKYINKYKKEMEHPLEFSIAVDAIMRTIAYSTDISEATINYSAKKDNK